MLALFVRSVGVDFYDKFGEIISTLIFNFVMFEITFLKVSIFQFSAFVQQVCTAPSASYTTVFLVMSEHEACSSLFLVATSHKCTVIAKL